jgi:hypothetical protein
LGKRLAVLVAAGALCVPAVARANGDPASDYLLVQSVFLPFNAKIKPEAASRLSAVVQAADKAKFKIKVALIASRYDLGTAFSLYNKPQRYAEFLGFELSFVYRDRLLVVMPNGFGYSVKGKPDRKASRALKGLPGPGKDATKQAEAATTAVRRLAAAAGRRLSAPAGGGGSAARDRLTIAAAATAGIALLAGLVLYRRQRRERHT